MTEGLQHKLVEVTNESLGDEISAKVQLIHDAIRVASGDNCDMMLCIAGAFWVSQMFLDLADVMLTVTQDHDMAKRQALVESHAKAIQHHGAEILNAMVVAVKPVRKTAEA